MKPTVAATRPPRQTGVRSPNRDRTAPYKLIVLAPDAAEAVSAAGGLVVDALRAGWRVAVYLETLGEARALQILGVAGHALPPSFDTEAQRPDAVVFAATMYHRHRAVRRLVSDAVRRLGADAAAWGGTWSAAPAAASETEHHLSSAARAFTDHAMKAVASAAPSSANELFIGAFPRLTAAQPGPPG